MVHILHFSVYESIQLVFPLKAKDERNYHIFYEMLAGLPSQQKQAFYLQEAETYYYLNQVERDCAALSPVLSRLCRDARDVDTDYIWKCRFSLSIFIQGGDCGITGKNDAEDFLRLRAAMDILHFTPEDQSAIYRVLSSILHLGNVYFQRHEVVFPKSSLFYFTLMVHF